MMRAAAGHVLVTPTGDNNESEHGRLIVVENNKPQHVVYRGVVVHVGEGFPDAVEVGEVAHYTHYHELHGKHVVPHTHVVAWEGEE